MPAKSEAQRRFMCLLWKNPKLRKKHGISARAAKDFCTKPLAKGARKK